ncbi:hypothetical protein [Salinisphaera sp. Q1T1-3]|uniref:hypothetical protein n=1 Tax=Salinisphaera sp. Q1T1-3 TaxID=2321229 RepID=UPI001313DE28|nr:hypothetical protein [Salinisphaera sp. Q1T1-3]
MARVLSHTRVINPKNHLFLGWVNNTSPVTALPPRNRPAKAYGAGLGYSRAKPVWAGNAGAAWSGSRPHPLPAPRPRPTVPGVPISSRLPLSAYSLDIVDAQA